MNNVFMPSLSEDQSKTREIQTETFGYATGIFFRCDCGSHRSISPELLLSSQVKIDRCKLRKPLTCHVNSTVFELNHSVVLGLQMCGNSQKEGSILSGLMNLNCNPMGKRWTQIQEHLRKLILDIGNKVIEG
jgi:hypothetical protein